DNLNAAAAYERVKTYVGNRQAAGWRVYVCTSPHTGAATQNARLGQLATLIRDDAEGLGYDVIDLRADSRFQDETNT
ncbi:hypothetical protein, partial [Tritonibacter sp. SIMBA_163]|uniref:hypothetical protein n=1 Tax=Tritonibacter sp. SIMBA_163 TaxID=3080868 RepID=UPI00397F0239